MSNEANFEHFGKPRSVLMQRCADLLNQLEHQEFAEGLEHAKPLADSDCLQEPAQSQIFVLADYRLPNCLYRPPTKLDLV